MRNAFYPNYWPSKIILKKIEKKIYATCLFSFFSFLIQDIILLWSNLSVYVFEALTWRVEPLPLPPTPYKHLYL